MDPLVEAELLKEAGSRAFVFGDLEFRAADDGTSARTALPKGTTRK